MNPNFLMLNIEHTSLGSDWNWKNVCSPFARIFFVTSGQAVLHIGNRRVSMRKGFAYFLPPNLVHSYECSEQITMYYLHVYEALSLTSSMFDSYDFPVEIPVVPKEFNIIFSTLCRDYPDFRLRDYDPSSYDNRNVFLYSIRRYEQLDVASRLYLSGLLRLIMSRLLIHAQLRKWLSDQRFVKVVDYINSNLDRDISTTDIAGIACLSESYFTRYFKTVFGMSPMNYILQKKIMRAQILLLTSNLAVSEIGYSCGFADCSYFIRVFRKLTGTTPHQYRLSSK